MESVKSIFRIVVLLTVLGNPASSGADTLSDIGGGREAVAAGISAQTPDFAPEAGVSVQPLGFAPADAGISGAASTASGISRAGVAAASPAVVSASLAGLASTGTAPGGGQASRRSRAPVQGRRFPGALPVGEPACMGGPVPVMNVTSEIPPAPMAVRQGIAGKASVAAQANPTISGKAPAFAKANRSSLDRGPASIQPNRRIASRVQGSVPEASAFSRAVPKRPQSASPGSAAPLAQGDLLDSFPAPTGYPFGMDYDVRKGGVWISSEENIGGSTIVSMLDVDPPYTVLKSFDAVGIAVSPYGGSTGVCVLPNGNLLFADFNGDLAVIDDYLFEISPDTLALVNYWPLDGSTYGGNNNTSTDGTSVDGVFDVTMDPGGNVFVTCAFNCGSNIHELELVPGTPGTWRTVAVHTQTAVAAPFGIDRIDCPFFSGWLVGTWGLLGSTTVAFLDPTFATTASFAANHDSNTFNSGVVALPSRGEPMRIWTVDDVTDRVGIFDSGVTCGAARVPHTWVLEAPLPRSSMDSVVVEYQGETYVVAGYGSNGEAYKYNPTLDQWTRLADQPSPTIDYPVDGSLGYGTDANPKIYLIPDTASAQADMLVYDIVNNYWVTLPLSGGFTARWAADMTYDPVHNLIYISGGATTNGSGDLTELWSYDPAVDTFTQLASFATPRDFHASCYYKGKVYIAGGAINVPPYTLSSTQVYDVATNTWSPENADLGPLPDAWWGMGDALQGNRFWLMAGVDPSGLARKTTGFFELDSGDWVEGPEVQNAVYRVEGDLQGGDPYLVGGSSGGFTPVSYNEHYISSEERILLYADDYIHKPSNTYPDQALQLLGLSYTAHYYTLLSGSDFAGFETSLGRGPWDLVIVEHEVDSVPSSTMDMLHNYAAAGGRLIFQSWETSFFSGHPLLADVGATFVSNDNEPPDPVYWWRPGHPFFQTPHSVPEFTSLTGGIYGTYGQHVEPLPGFSALAGYTVFGPTPNEAALIVGAGNRTVFKGFLDGQNDADLDTDGIPDGAELWVNMIFNNLGMGARPLTPVYFLLLQ